MKKIITFSMILAIVIICIGQFPSVSEARPHPRLHLSFFHPWFWGPWAPWGPRVVVLRPNFGYLDLDVVPEEAEVYINGKKYGICDEYDGFPDYLYLESGVYTIRFHLDGYLDYEREITIKPGFELEFNTRLEKGSQPARYYTDKPEIYDYDERSSPRYDTDTIDRPYPDQNEEIEQPAQTLPAEPAPPEQPENMVDQYTQGTGTVQFRIFPKDATVYIDGSFFGVAHKLNEPDSPFEMSTGKHIIEIMMPGYEIAKQEITVKEDEITRLRVILVQKTI